MRSSSIALAAASLVATLVPPASAFYLPGTAPHDYMPGEKVDFYVNALAPMLNSKLRSMISYDYYNPKFHFCQPAGGPKKQPESLGSILFGDRIFSSGFEIRMLENSTCQSLCTSEIPGEDAEFINNLIKEDYGYNFLADRLPAAEMKKDERTGETFYDIGGVNLGDDETNPEVPALNNHFDIYLQYHSRDGTHYRVVGVLVYPRSTPWTANPTCEVTTASMVLSEKDTNKVVYTYSVGWLKSDIPWGLRWDNYLHVFDPRIHWFSLVNSLVIVIFLCVMVATILLRTVSRDISRYNAIDLSEDVQEDWGWKLVHGEVFRPPPHPMLLSVMVGTGSQLCAMVSVTLVFALFGFLSPSNRGSLATVLLISWTLFGFVAGYVSNRVYTSLDGKDFQRVGFATAFMFPTVIFVVIFLLDLFLVGAGSSGAVPFGTILAVVGLWFLISVPLNVAGTYYGIRHGGFEHPTRVNQIPRQIPPPPTYLKRWPSALLAGLLPWAAAFVELFFVLSSLFGSKAYYAFGFLFLTFCVVVLTTATITVLFTYFMLCAEEYRWHWRSFTTGGGSALWLLLYGLFYWASRLSLDSMASVVLYIGYLLLLAMANFLMTGAIGFVASYFAIRRLYAAIRVD